MKLKTLAEAAENFVTHFGGYLMDDIATHLTCSEVEALADLLVALGEQRLSELWIRAHAEGDDCGDMHCLCNICQEV